MVELGEQVHKVPGQTQQKFEDWWRPEGRLSNADRTDEHLIADADVVYIARSKQRRHMQHRWNSQKANDVIGTSWEMMPNRYKVDGSFAGISRHITWAVWSRNTVPTLDARCATSCLEDTRMLACRGSGAFGRAKTQSGHWRVGEGYETNQLECNYKRDTFGNSTNTWLIDTFERTKSSGNFIISD